jgi:hypothetical protein
LAGYRRVLKIDSLIGSYKNQVAIRGRERVVLLSASLIHITPLPPSLCPRALLRAAKHFTAQPRLYNLFEVIRTTDSERPAKAQCTRFVRCKHAGDRRRHMVVITPSADQRRATTLPPVFAAGLPQ